MYVFVWLRAPAKLAYIKTSDYFFEIDAFKERSSVENVHIGVLEALSRGSRSFESFSQSPSVDLQYHIHITGLHLIDFLKAREDAKSTSYDYVKQSIRPTGPPLLTLPFPVPPSWHQPSNR